MFENGWQVLVFFIGLCIVGLCDYFVERALVYKLSDAQAEMELEEMERAARIAAGKARTEAHLARLRAQGMRVRYMGRFEQ